MQSRLHNTRNADAHEQKDAARAAMVRKLANVDAASVWLCNSQYAI